MSWLFLAIFFGLLTDRLCRPDIMTIISEHLSGLWNDERGRLPLCPTTGHYDSGIPPQPCSRHGQIKIDYTAENRYFSEIVTSQEFLPTDQPCKRQVGSCALPLASGPENTYLSARQNFFEETKTPLELDRINADNENSTILPPAHQAKLCTNDLVGRPNAIPCTPNQQPILPDNVNGSISTKGRRGWLAGIAFSIV